MRAAIVEAVDAIRLVIEVDGSEEHRRAMDAIRARHRG